VPRAAPSYARPFPPPQHPDPIGTLWHHAILSLIKRLNPARRRRSNPRVIKRKISKWLAKRDHHDHWPQPTHSPKFT